jgi:hypothetical protein
MPKEMDSDWSLALLAGRALLAVNRALLAVNRCANGEKVIGHPAE